MTTARGRLGLRVIAAALIGACAAHTAAAAVVMPPQPDPEQLKLDGAIQGLKDEVLNFNRDATLVEESVLYPSHTRTSVYIGVTVPALLMKTINVAIDDKPAQSYAFEDDESRSLNRSAGLRRVVLASLEPGAHRLSVDYTAQFADAKPSDAPLTGHYEAIFDKSSREAELELTLMRSSRLSSPQLRLRDRKLAAMDEALPPPPSNKRPRRRKFTLP